MSIYNGYIVNSIGHFPHTILEAVNEGKRSAYISGWFIELPTGSRCLVRTTIINPKLPIGLEDGESVKVFIEPTDMMAIFEGSDTPVVKTIRGQFVEGTGKRYNSPWWEPKLPGVE